MKSTNILDKISDGKLYDIEDMVKADTCGCNGCNDCCLDVGDLVVLTPFDVYEIVNCLGVTFDDLLGDKIELRQNNKILLPYLKMQDNNRCSFLNEKGRCIIHSKRPNICRMFPLGRVYQDNDFKYFLQIGNCPKEDLKDVKVSDWVGIENYDENKEFILEWYKLTKALAFRLKFVRDEKEIEEINQIY
ncbi:flagellin N-methylase family protein [[Clostridium] sordellii ATCC 9714]|nr:flagellin N-methylase family protein [[Clostridium] sordellii ATCC 9714] [Paeniclostridium sordellii ATCC 9714]